VKLDSDAKLKQSPNATKKPQPPKTFTQFNEPEEIGISTSLIAPRSGTLFFKVNDSAAELGDNRGGYEVTVEEIK
jgi:hypothetical protein